jgi:hypothetical protein
MIILIAVPATGETFERSWSLTRRGVLHCSNGPASITCSPPC